MCSQPSLLYQNINKEFRPCFMIGFEAFPGGKVGFHCHAWWGMKQEGLDRERGGLPNHIH